MDHITNVKDIIREYLVANGYDGLFNFDGECACLLDDLMPCEQCCDECIPGYRADDPTGEYDFLMQSERPPAGA